MKELPNTEQWTPNENKAETLRKIIFEKCKHVEAEILSRSKQEQTYNINNFDSGIPIEGIISESLENLLPKRYKISKGIVSDRDGKTSGEHDIVLFNESWFPYLTGENSGGTRTYFPIEGVYAIGEVKQKLSLENLDEAMRKLVIAQRLKRPRAGENRYNENRKSGDSELGISNSLFTFLIATGFDEGSAIDDLFDRFFKINKTLYRQEMVRSICVLGDFFISWVVLNEKTGEYDAASFTSKDEDLPILPVLRLGKAENESSYYDLVMSLGAHLNSSVLASEDIYVAYGNRNYKIKLPPPEKYTIHNY